MRDVCFLLFVLVVAVALSTAMAFSAEVSAPGVIANERVVNLPNDSEKWYLSIVGVDGEARYEEILAWFDGDDALKQVRSQVHFREIDSNTIIYKTRYASNVEGLPTVRLQKHNGEVIYEAAGRNLPLTAGGLYGALANSSSKAQGLGIFRPWGRRRRLDLLGPGPIDPFDYNCPDGRCPIKPPTEPEEDPPPAPIDDGGAPEMAAQSAFDMGSAGIGAGVALLCLSGGSGLSLFVQWRRKYRQ